MSDVKSPSSLIQNSLKGILEQANKGIDNLKTSPQMKSLGKAVESAYGQVSDTTSKLVAVADHQIKHNLFVTGNGEPFMKAENDEWAEVNGLKNFPKILIPDIPSMKIEGEAPYVKSIRDAMLFPLTAVLGVEEDLYEKNQWKMENVQEMYKAILKLPAAFFEDDGSEDGMSWKEMREGLGQLRHRPDILAKAAVEKFYDEKIDIWVRMLVLTHGYIGAVDQGMEGGFISATTQILEIELGDADVPENELEIGTDAQWAVIGQMGQHQKRSLLKVVKSLQSADGIVHAGLLSMDEIATALSAIYDISIATQILNDRSGFSELTGSDLIDVTKLISLKMETEAQGGDQRLVLLAAENLGMVDINKVVRWSNLTEVEHDAETGARVEYSVDGEAKLSHDDVIDASRPWVDKIALRAAREQAGIYRGEIINFLRSAITWEMELNKRAVEKGVTLDDDDEHYLTHALSNTKNISWKERQTQLFYGIGELGGSLSLERAGEVHRLFLESERMIPGHEKRMSWLNLPQKFGDVENAKEYLDTFDEMTKLYGNPLTHINAVTGRMQMQWLVDYGRWLKKSISGATMLTGNKYYVHTARMANYQLPEWKLEDEYEGKMAEYHFNVLQTMNAQLLGKIGRIVETYHWEDGHNTVALTAIGLCSAFAGIGAASFFRNAALATETAIGWRAQSASGLVWNATRTTAAKTLANTARASLWRRTWTRAAGTLLEFEGAWGGFTAGSNAFMVPYSGVPSMEQIHKELLVNGAIFAVLDVASAGLLRIFRINPVKGAKVLDGTPTMERISTAELKGLFEGASISRGPLARLRALNNRQLIKSAIGVNGGWSGFLFSASHLLGVTTILHNSNFFLKGVNLDEPMPENQQPSFWTTLSHMAVITLGARGLHFGSWMIDGVLKGQHKAELAKVKESISAGLGHIKESGTVVGTHVSKVRESWKQEVEENGGQFDPRGRMEDLLDAVRADSVLKAAEVRMLDSEIDYSERGVDAQRVAIDEAMTKIATRLLMEYSVELASYGKVGRDGVIAVSRGEVDLLVRHGKFFNKLFGDSFRLEQVESGSSEMFYFQIVGTGTGLPAGRNLIKDLVTIPTESRPGRAGLRMVRPGVYTPKTEDPKGDSPTTPGGFLTTNLL